MEKLKILLLAIVVIIVASHLGLNWFKWGELDAARDDIKDAQKHIADAVKSLDLAQQNISLFIGIINNSNRSLNEANKSLKSFKAAM